VVFLSTSDGKFEMIEESEMIKVQQYDYTDDVR
jgi:hypothetical protein